MPPLPLASDVMLSHVITASAEQPVLDAIAGLLSHQITGAPVVDDAGRYLGMFSEKCCMNVLTFTAALAADSSSPRRDPTRAGDCMIKKVITLSPDTDVFEAISRLLKHSISGAPVVDAAGTFLGMFSEKTSMQVLIESAWEQLPTSTVAACMNTDQGRVISEDTDLITIAGIFLDTPYRRLAVVRDGKLIGQISRRDVLRAEHHLSPVIASTQDTQETAIATDDQATDEFQFGEWADTPVREFMDTKARTIVESVDLLDIARIFRETPYRRLPVLRESQLVGLVTRRHLLRATHRALAPPAARTAASPVYLSSLDKLSGSKFD